jgi:hypothetical protein
MLARYSIILLLMVICTGCNYYNYTPRSKRAKYQAKPSIFVFSSIADFRLTQGRWPVSLADLTGKNAEYMKALKGFQYGYAHFRIIDSNNMVFTFSDHITDVKNNNYTGLTELNSLGGKARFSKKNAKFVWKVKMH